MRPRCARLPSDGERHAARGAVLCDAVPARCCRDSEVDGVARARRDAPTPPHNSAFPRQLHPPLRLPTGSRRQLPSPPHFVPAAAAGVAWLRVTSELRRHVDNRADGLARVHRLEALADVTQRHAVRDELVHLEVARHVAVDEAGQLGAAAHAPEGRASPHAAGDELEGARGDLLPGRRDADDAALAPALVAALEGGAHGDDVADALEAVVHAAVGESDDHVLHGSVVRLRVERLGGAELERARELVLVDVDGDDARRAGLLAPHDGGEAHGAEPEHGAGGALADLHRLRRRAPARGHAAAQQAHGRGRRVGADLGQRDLRHDRVLGEGGAAHEVVERRVRLGAAAPHAEAAGAVGHHAAALRRADLGAQVGAARVAELAVAALGDVEADDLVAHRHARHALADALHRAGALVAQDAGERALGVVPSARVFVRVADAGRLHAHAHLAGARRAHRDLDHLEVSLGLPADGRAARQGALLPADGALECFLGGHD
mmetsp:Transcript_908/g.2866  ORF Transcript_908/g.2866 Transcript_908/m.2866 type:complete len:492 (-) Transcript_908:40-1515(-)